MRKRKHEKLKVITFSYDDCTIQDRRLVDLFNKYGVKATFNVNSELLGTKNELLRKGVKVRHDKLNAYMSEAIAELYNRNCIDEKVMMSLGIQLNELYLNANVLIIELDTKFRKTKILTLVKNKKIDKEILK